MKRVCRCPGLPVSRPPFWLVYSFCVYLTSHRAFRSPFFLSELPFHRLSYKNILFFFFFCFMSFFSFCYNLLKLFIISVLLTLAFRLFYVGVTLINLSDLNRIKKKRLAFIFVKIVQIYNLTVFSLFLFINNSFS
jgi:hypothetical protein